MIHPNPTHVWSGHTPLHHIHFHRPTSLEELQNIVDQAQKISVIGAGHSFNSIADSEETLLDLSLLNSPLEFDLERHQLRLPAGIWYEQVSEEIFKRGYALPNVASLQTISFAGAVNTATHGSGDQIGNLSSQVVAMEVVNHRGEIVKYSLEKDADEFNAVLIHLGAIGVVTHYTLQLVPAFHIQQNAYQELSFEDVYRHFDEITSAAYSVSLFPTWQEDFVDTLWLKHRISSENVEQLPTPDRFFSAKRRIPEIAQQTDEYRTLTPFETPNPWYKQLHHYRFHSPKAEGQELQSEYFVSREYIVDAIKTVKSLHRKLKPILGLSEIRTMAADEIWLSPAYQQASVGIHFNWLKKGAEVEAFLPLLEEALAPFHAKPHFGKLFHMPENKLRKVYPNLSAVQERFRTLDPQGKFANRFISTYLR